MSCPYDLWKNSNPTCCCILREGFPKRADCSLVTPELDAWRSCADDIARIYARQQEPVNTRPFGVAYSEWERMNHLVYHVLPVAGGCA